MTESCYWNGEPCQARKVTLGVADPEIHSNYWAEELVGQRVDAVEVVYGREPIFYLYDGAWTPTGDYLAFLERHGLSTVAQEPGFGWEKVTEGRGSPSYPHRSVYPEPGSVEARSEEGSDA